MKRVWILSALAGVLWLVMFSPWTFGSLPFWPAMVVSSGLLAAGALWVDHRQFRQVCTFHWWHVPLGLGSAIVLYLMFFVGHKIAAFVLPFASDQVDLVYRTRSQADLWLIAVLLFAWIGPAEEIFWRAFVQRRLGQRYGRFAGFAVTVVVYTVVHIWSFNLMLLAAAGLCGLFWGAMFYRFRSLWPSLISHAVWDVVIFVFLPIR